MKNNPRITGWLVFIIVMIAAVGILYRENFDSSDKIAENKLQQQIKAESKDVAESSESMNGKSDSNSTINDVTKTDKGKIVTISGVIDKVDNSKDGKHLFVTLSDNTGSILVPIFSNANIDKSQFIVGRNFKVTGEVEIYNNKLEIIPKNAEDVVGDNFTRITNTDIGKPASIEGVIISNYDHPDGHVFLTVMLDSGQEVAVPLFSSLASRSEDYPKNSIIKVSGVVDIYNDKLQVIPESIDEVILIAAGEDQAYDYIEIGNITEEHRGDAVYIKGIVSDLNTSKDNDSFFTIRDHSGQIKGVQFSADTDELPDRLAVLAESNEDKIEIAITGTIDVYKGKLEIIVNNVWYY